jgi:GTP cyclohydrolase I
MTVKTSKTTDASLRCPGCGARIEESADFDGMCEMCHCKLRTEIEYANDLSGVKLLRDGVRMMLDGLHKLYGIDPDDANFKDTPERVARLMMEMNYGTNEQAAKDILTSSAFPSSYTGLIASDNIRCYALCPHHMVVVQLDVNIAYVPGPRMVGLSKIARFAETLAASMILQEEYTHRLASLFKECTDALGVGVIVVGKHNCVAARGVKKPDVDNITSELNGIFMMNSSLKQEWMDLVKMTKMLRAN